MLLTEKIGNALIVGSSVIVTGPDGADDLLDVVSAKLDKAGMRVLAIRPPLDAASFMSQFARGWRLLLKSNDKAAVASLLPKSSGERFTMFVHDAHTMPRETVGQVERMAQAWPGLRVVFGGEPDTTERLHLENHPTLRQRISVWLQVPTPDAEAGHSEARVEGAPGPRPVRTTRPMVQVPRRRRGRATRVYGAAGLLLGVAAAVAAVPNAGRIQTTVAGWETELRTWTGGRMPAAATPASAPPGQMQDLGVPGTGRLPAGTAPATPRQATPMPGQATPEPANAQPAPSRNRAEINRTPLQTLPPAPPPPLIALTQADVVPPVAAEPATLPEPISPELADSITRHARAILYSGNVTDARPLLGRAAAAGNGGAALTLSASYDAGALRRIRATDTRADRAQSATWFAVAQSLQGSPKPGVPAQPDRKH